MSSRARIGLLVTAVAIAVITVIALRPSDEPGRIETKANPTSSPTPTPTGGSSADETTTPSPSPTPTIDRGPLLTTAKVTEIRVKKGDVIRFRARSSQAEEIHVHGYDLSRAVKAGRTTEVTFKADIEGIFEIEFEHSGTPIAELRVDPS